MAVSCQFQHLDTYFKQAIIFNILSMPLPHNGAGVETINQIYLPCPLSELFSRLFILANRLGFNSHRIVNKKKPATI
jgi:hypothetical protein